MLPSKKQRIAGWVLTILVGLFLIFSSTGKFIEWEGKEEMFAKMGFTIDMMFKIGVLEIAVAVLYLIPQSSFLGAILLTGYLGGAVVTHLRVDEPFFFPIILGILVWIGVALRFPEIFSLARGRHIGGVTDFGHG